MPRLLFVSHHFPPDTTIGAKRSRRIAVELHKRGWHVDVLAAAPLFHEGHDPKLAEGLAGIDVHWTMALEPRPLWKALRTRLKPQEASPASAKPAQTAPARSRPAAVEHAMRWVRDAEVPDSTIGWLPPAVLAGWRLPRPDVVLATLPFFSTALVARELSVLHRAPLVLDYRDPWQDEHRRARQAPWRRRTEDAMEAWCLHGTSALTATTPGIAGLLRARTSAPVEVVLNAGEPERFVGVEPVVFEGKTAVYVGALYGGRGLRDVLAAVAKLPDWHVHYAGQTPEEALREAAALGLSERVTAEGNVTHRRALALQRGATVNLCVVGPEHGRQIPGKLFEQVTCGLPVLLIAPEGSDAETVTAGLAQVHTLRPGDVDGVRSWLQALQPVPLPPVATPPTFSVEATMDVLDATLRRVLPRG